MLFFEIFFIGLHTLPDGILDRHGWDCVCYRHAILYGIFDRHSHQTGRNMPTNVSNTFPGRRFTKHRSISVRSRRPDGDLYESGLFGPAFKS
jgi:hypothetical protein